MSRMLWMYALLLGLAVLAAPVAQAQPGPAEVFRLLVARGQDGGLALTWRIQPGHYLYRERLAASMDGRPLSLVLPQGQRKDDPTFGTTEVYHETFTAGIAKEEVPAAGTIRVTFQGCAEQGTCLPPMVRDIDLATLTVSDAHKAANPAVSMSAREPATTLPPQSASQDGLSATLGGSLPAMLAAFLGFGVLLALTPCVFPMIPILSGMLASSGERLSVWRGLSLSGAYVLAMASAYALLGVAAAWWGLNLQLALQTPLAVGGMGLVFVALGLSMFGLYDLQLPARWTTALAGATAGAGGSLAGAATLGFVSALMVGPCVTPPLAAALLYVAQTGNVSRGAAALFALGLGMGLPLMVFGAFGGRLLPRSGQWLVYVKHAFGFVFLGLAVWMLGRVLPLSLSLGLRGLLAVACGIWLGAMGLRGSSHGIRVLLPVAGSTIALLGLLLFGAAMGGSTAALPNWLLPTSPAIAQDVAGQTVSTPESFDQALAVARAQGRPILVDFTAGWCPSCQENDALAQREPQIRARLARVTVIRVDLTAETADSKALMQRFDVFGPPTMLFLDARSGQEIAGTRTVGAVSAGQFLRSLEQAGA